MNGPNLPVVFSRTIIHAEARQTLPAYQYSISRCTSCRMGGVWVITSRCYKAVPLLSFLRDKVGGMLVGTLCFVCLVFDAVSCHALGGGVLGSSVMSKGGCEIWSSSMMGLFVRISHVDNLLCNLFIVDGEV